MSSVSEESPQEKLKQGDFVGTPCFVPFVNTTQEAEGEVGEGNTVEYFSSASGVSYQKTSVIRCSNTTSACERYRYSETELELYSVNAKLPADCVEASFELVGVHQKVDKSPSVRPKHSPSFVASKKHYNNWHRGSLSSGESPGETSDTFRQFPRKEDLSKKRQFKQNEAPRSYETKPRFNRSQKLYSGSKKLLSEVWYYRDPQDEIQGPFSLFQLRQWLEAGYYDGSLAVCESGSNNFRSLDSVLKTIKAYDAPPGMGQTRDHNRTKGHSRSPRSDTTKFDSSTQELELTPVSMSQDEMQSQGRVSGAHNKEDLEKTSNETGKTALSPSKYEGMSQNESCEVTAQARHLVFGNDISVSTESDDKDIQENFPLERDIEELERDLVSNLDLDGGVFSSKNSTASIPDKSLVVEHHRPHHQHFGEELEEQEQTKRNRNPPMSPEEYLMYIDPAVAKASVKVTRSVQDEQYSSFMSSDIASPDQSIPYKSHRLSEKNMRDHLPQQMTEPYVARDYSQNNYETDALNKLTGSSNVEMDDQGFQESKKGKGKKKKKSPSNPNSVAMEASKEALSVNSERSPRLERQFTSHGENAQGRGKVEIVSNPQSPSDFWAANNKAFDSFFKAFSDSAKPAWNNWSRSASNSRYPLSLKEIQLEEERRQREEKALKAAKESSLEGLQSRKSRPWDIRHTESSPFVDIQRAEIEQQALRSKSDWKDSQRKLPTGSSWSDKVARSVPSSIAQQQTNSVPTDKRKESERVHSSIGFWDYIDQSLETKESKPPKKEPTSSTKHSVDKYESLDKNKSFGASIPEDLRMWCEEQFAELIGSRDVTLAEFLASLKSTDEIREYAFVYLGKSKKTTDFVEEFVRRLEFEEQKVSLGSSTPKSGRRRKKS
ncbi:hypothetical protein GAYE_SCF13G3494 [Galdieria yellowstonensis]|uniref:GYF domain-containing protein n=1 Tax=Galdieria yellowstonensis TaxID=3028027 RepID=A0AAV9IE95_9RHOD|nr:hypothetical protein GAYE_SCF13G3494 [Galdieria yellowstonensis]